MKGLNLNDVFSKNNYIANFVGRKTHRKADSNSQTSTLALLRQRLYPTSAVLLKLSLSPYNIRVAHKPITTLRRIVTNVKDKDKPEDRQEAVYKIKCCDCQANYNLVKPAETSTRDGLNTNDRTHKLSKRQSLSTTVLFRTTFPRKIMLNLFMILTSDGIFDIFLSPNELFESFMRNTLYVKDLIKAIKTPSPSLIKQTYSNLKLE